MEWLRNFHIWNVFTQFASSTAVSYDIKTFSGHRGQRIATEYATGCMRKFHFRTFLLSPRNIIQSGHSKIAEKVRNLRTLHHECDRHAECAGCALCLGQIKEAIMRIPVSTCCILSTHNGSDELCFLIRLLLTVTIHVCNTRVAISGNVTITLFYFRTAVLPYFRTVRYGNRISACTHCRKSHVSKHLHEYLITKRIANSSYFIHWHSIGKGYKLYLLNLAPLSLPWRQDAFFHVIVTKWLRKLIAQSIVLLLLVKSNF